MIEIIQPGILASIQDLGRYGLRSLGVGVSGAMDGLAMRIANIMVGNPDDAAGIETTFGGFVCSFNIDCLFSITGGCPEISLDGQSLPGWSVAIARAGQVLEVAASSVGMRNYIAFAGGVDVPVMMGSRATDLKGGFGGYQGRPLRHNDRLRLLESEHCSHLIRPFGISVQEAELVLDSDVTKVRMVPAAEWNDYSLDTQKEFLGTDWLLDHVSNRVGYRLTGPALVNGKQRELLSHGIVPGTVQLPPAGQPVVQMLDANTCGGYPKLGVVIAADLWKLAQTRLGKAVRFSLVTPREALDALRKERFLLTAVRGLSALAHTDNSPVQNWSHTQADPISLSEEQIISAPAVGVLHFQHPDRMTGMLMLAEGEMVEKDQILGYLESGILVLPIKAQAYGRIERILAKDRQQIDLGTPIMSLKML